LAVAGTLMGLKTRYAHLLQHLTLGTHAKEQRPLRKAMDDRAISEERER
jgi:hypothetical protein